MDCSPNKGGFEKLDKTGIYIKALIKLKVDKNHIVFPKIMFIFKNINQTHCTWPLQSQWEREREIRKNKAKLEMILGLSSGSSNVNNQEKCKMHSNFRNKCDKVLWRPDD